MRQGGNKPWRGHVHKSGQGAAGEKRAKVERGSPGRVANWGRDREDLARDRASEGSVTLSSQRQGTEGHLTAVCSQPTCGCHREVRRKRPLPEGRPSWARVRVLYVQKSARGQTLTERGLTWHTGKAAMAKALNL